MRYRVEEVRNEFQAREAAAMSGVSQNLQRDWRRRGLLDVHEGDGRKRFTAFEIALLAVMGILSDAKLSVKSAQSLALDVCPFIDMFFDQIETAYEFEGDGRDNLDMPEFLKQIGREEHSRFAFITLPADENCTMFLRRTFSDLETVVSQGSGWRSGLLLDLRGIAEDIVAKAPRPLIRFVVIEEDEE